MDYIKHICRAKRLYNSAWVYGYYACLESKHCIYDESSTRWYEIIPETIGQCSSTRDRNGTLIFDKDIVRAYKHNEVPIIARVSHRNGCFYFGNWNWVEFLNVFRNIQVIGNVFDEDKEEM